MAKNILILTAIIVAVAIGATAAYISLRQASKMGVEQGVATRPEVPEQPTTTEPIDTPTSQKNFFEECKKANLLSRADLARIQNDPSLCEGDSICEDYFKRIAEPTCEKLSNGPRDFCYMNLAIERRDEILCGKISTPCFFGRSVRSECYSTLAFLKHDPSICKKVETASLASSCIKYFQVKGSSDKKGDRKAP